MTNTKNTTGSNNANNANKNASSIVSSVDVSKVNIPSWLPQYLKDTYFKAENITPTQANKPAPNPPSASSASTAPSAPTTASAAVEAPPTAMSFDEAFSRFRMMVGALPANQRQKLIPMLIERIAKRVKPEDVEDFKTMAYSLSGENDNNDALGKYLPILLILSMMRGG